MKAIYLSIGNSLEPTAPPRPGLGAIIYKYTKKRTDETKVGKVQIQDTGYRWFYR